MSDENPYRYSIMMSWEDFRRMELKAQLLGIRSQVECSLAILAAEEWQAMVDRVSGTHLKLIVDNTKTKTV